MRWFNTKYRQSDTRNSTASFVHNRNRENIKSGEKHSTLFGKIARYFADLKMVAFTGDYNDLNGKPLSFPPSSHQHNKSDITDFPSSLPASDVPAWAKAANKPSYSWGEIGSKPSSFPPASHTHNYLPLAGGTTDGRIWQTQSSGVKHLVYAAGESFVGVELRRLCTLELNNSNLYGANMIEIVYSVGFRDWPVHLYVMFTHENANNASVMYMYAVDEMYKMCDLRNTDPALYMGKVHPLDHKPGGSRHRLSEGVCYGFIYRVNSTKFDIYVQTEMAWPIYHVHRVYDPTNGVKFIWGPDNKININSIPSGAVKVYYGPNYHEKAFNGIPFLN